MGKYDPLHRFLENAAREISEMTLSFQQIEQILDDPLPYTARHSRSWWANECRSGTEPQASSWLEAQWEVDAVEPRQAWVRFRRVPGQPDHGEGEQ